VPCSSYNILSVAGYAAYSRVIPVKSALPRYQPHII